MGRVDGDCDAVRFHPAQYKHDKTLIDHLQAFDIAIGYSTTALVTAAIEGLQVVCRDSNHIMARPDWREVLPWADWSDNEIESGELWEHLRQSPNLPANL